MRSHHKLLAFCVIAGCYQAAALAVELEKPIARGVTWTLVEGDLQGKPGATVVVRVKGVIPDGWHTYTVKEYAVGTGPNGTKVAVEPADSAKIEGEVSYDPKPYVDELTSKQFGNSIDAFKKEVVFSIPVKIAATATGDSVTLSLKITSVICNDNLCKNPVTTELAPVILLKKKVAENLSWTPKPGALASEVKIIIADQHQCVQIAPGGVFPFQIKFMVEGGWHTFPAKQSNEKMQKEKFIPSTTFKVELADASKSGPPSKSEPKDTADLPVFIEGPITADRPPIVVHDDGFETDIEVFEDVVFTVPVRLNPKFNVGAGEVAITISVNTQACQKVCKPIKAKLNATLEIVKDAVPAPAPAQIAERKGSNGKNDHAEGLFAFLLAAAGAGLVSLLTPCVFPMIPITVSFFTKRKHISHARAVRDALIFSSGIVFTYVGVAFLLELVAGKSVRDLATHPGVNLLIFVIFVAMAFSLFGYYDLQLPTGLINRLNKSAHGGDSVFGLLLMGLVFTMTSFSCTGPFVGTIMIEAVKGDWLWPMLGMTVFATMFALPFFLLALFPSALKSLPKSGGWLNSVKVVMGFIEIAAALKFLSNADLTWTWGILTFEVFLGVWSALALASGIYLLGKIRFPHDTPLKNLSKTRIGLATLFLATGAYLAVAAFGKAPLGIMTAYVPPNPYPVRLTDTWEDGLAAAKKLNKPIFYDFTGITCTNCRRMESNMFKRDEIRKIMDNFIVIQLYTDVSKTPAQVAAKEKNSKVQLERFDNETLPFYVIVTPDDKVLAQFDKGYTEDTNEFKAFLQKGLLVSAVKETPDWQSGLAVARKEGKPMFFNFENACESPLTKSEAETFKRMNVDALLKNFVRLDMQSCAHDEREAKAAADPLRAAVNPFYAIVAMDGNVLADIDKAEFLKDSSPTPAVTNFKRFLAKAVAPAIPAAQTVQSAQASENTLTTVRTAQN